MALPGVGTFQCALFEGEDLWHHRLFGTHMRSGMFIRNLGLATRLTFRLDRLMDRDGLRA